MTLSSVRLLHDSMAGVGERASEPAATDAVSDRFFACIHFFPPLVPYLVSRGAREARGRKGEERWERCGRERDLSWGSAGAGPPRAAA